jgi:hypothetical protein
MQNQEADSSLLFLFITQLFITLKKCFQIQLFLFIHYYRLKHSYFASEFSLKSNLNQNEEITFTTNFDYHNQKNYLINPNLFYQLFSFPSQIKNKNTFPEIIKNLVNDKLNEKSRSKIPIFIKLFNGIYYSLVVKANINILKIKNKIEDQIGISKNQQRLMFFEKKLDDNKSIKDYFIETDSTIHLSLLLSGGSQTIKSINYQRELNNIKTQFKL